MLPHNAISLSPVFAPYLSPDIDDTEDLESFEQGGIAINDPSQGRQVQTWRAWIESDTIKLSPLSGSPITTLVTGAGITSVSLAFDSNMSPVVCYLQAGVLKLRWFNTVIEAYQTDTYAGATSGRVSSDDKRRSQEGVSDVIFGYTRDGTLYWRQQRDRYGVERAVGTSGTSLLVRLGMNAVNRLQFELN